MVTNDFKDSGPVESFDEREETSSPCNTTSSQPRWRGNHSTKQAALAQSLQHRLNVHTSPGTGTDRPNPSTRRSITFAPISYTSIHEQKLRQERSSLSQASEACSSSSAEPDLYGPRARCGHDKDSQNVKKRSASWSISLSETRPLIPVKRRRTFHGMPRSHAKDADYLVSPSHNSIPNNLQAAGVSHRDFASSQRDGTRSAVISECHQPSISSGRTWRVSSWIPRPNDGHRRSSILSLPDTLRRRASHSYETILGGVLAPTKEEVASFYSTPGAAAFDLDLEKGSEEPVAPVNPARGLTRLELLSQRLFFGIVIVSVNAACIYASVSGNSGAWVLAFVLLFKSRDFLSVWIQICCHVYFRATRSRQPIKPPGKAAWILSLIPTYSESEEQIIRTMFSLRDNELEKHRQVVCVMLDGKHRPINAHLTKVIASFEWKYVSLKWKTAILQIDAGWVNDVPTLCIEKISNSGKKDTLVLCHDLFNFPRDDMDESVRALREELWTNVLPQLTGDDNFPGFDLVFCTDADSIVHKGALASLANACLANPNAIAACGFVFVEYEPGLNWSFWNLYQQFQYSYGQIIRRAAEHFVGKVTCLPGCISMVVVRPEMARAIQKFAEPVNRRSILRHQVQYLGTDRRLTYSMLSQARHLHTLFVPEAGSETVAPQSLKHYLSQRRRWGANSYFNNYFYLVGSNMIEITRLGAGIEILRQSMVYFRIVIMALFIKGIITDFDIIVLLPIICIALTPDVWYAFVVTFKNRHLRSNWFKLLIGFFINRLISPFMSLTIFTLVARNLGSQVWGISGVTSGTPVTPAVATQVINEQATAETKAGQSEKSGS